MFWKFPVFGLSLFSRSHSVPKDDPNIFYQLQFIIMGFSATEPHNAKNTPTSQWLQNFEWAYDCKY